MARKSYKQLLIEEFPHLERYIIEQWEFYENEDESFVGTQTKENIAENIRIDIFNCKLHDYEEAFKQGYKIENKPQQSTGYRDTKDVIIREGDILVSQEHERYEKIHIVIFSEKRGYEKYDSFILDKVRGCKKYDVFLMGRVNYKSFGFKVIGNKYDDKKLLEMLYENQDVKNFRLYKILQQLEKNNLKKSA